MRILVVDDDVVILEILEIFLNSIKYHDISFARSAFEAMEMIASAPEPFECILLDINMPEMTGIQFLSKIRQTKTYEYVPVIMLTALSDRGNVTKAFCAGAWDYIVKPFEMFELEARIKNAKMRNRQFKNLLKQPRDTRRTLEFPRKVMAVANDSVAGPDNAIITRDAFANCFGSLIKERPTRLGVLTMMVDNFDDLSRKLSPEQFDQYLVELAKQLTIEFSNMQGIVSYQGEGVFMALSFVFAGLGEDILRPAAQRAARSTDAAVLQTLGHKTTFLVGKVLSQDLPENVEPTSMLEVARSYLVSGSNLQQ